MEYPLELTSDENGTYLVTCPDLPEVAIFGEGIEDAVANGTSAIQEAIATRMDNVTEIPRPSKGRRYAHVPLYLDLKIQLYWALADEGMSRTDLARLTGWSHTEVDGLLNPTQMNKLAQLEEAFAALNKIALVKLEPT